MYSGNTPVRELPVIKRNAGLHNFFHNLHVIRQVGRVVLRHKSWLGGPSSRRIRASQLSTPSPSTLQDAAVQLADAEAPSRRVIQELAAPSQLVEEWRVALGRHAREYGGTGIVTAVDDTVPYRSSRACDRAIRRQCTRNHALLAEKEAGFTEMDETMQRT